MSHINHSPKEESIDKQYIVCIKTQYEGMISMTDISVTDFKSESSLCARPDEGVVRYLSRGPPVKPILDRKAKFTIWIVPQSRGAVSVICTT